jgi:hypothetical protein
MRSGKPYRPSNSPDAVLVRDYVGFCGVEHVLYTDFNPAGKIVNPEPRSLAEAAIRSVALAPWEKDGIGYLMRLREGSVETALTPLYVAEILSQTGAPTPAEAMESLRPKET